MTASDRYKNVMTIITTTKTVTTVRATSIKQHGISKDDPDKKHNNRDNNNNHLIIMTRMAIKTTVIVEP